MTANAVSTYEALSRLLTYPDADYAEFAQQLPLTLAETDPEASSALEPFVVGIRELSLTELQELFTRTFDLSPACSLEVGWHLFGEEYARGAFMVSIRERLRLCGVAENGELPDHLTHILRLADAVEADERGKLVGTFMLPAIEKMLKAMEGKSNPYGDLIKTIAGVLERTPGARQTQKELVGHG